jgi:hypothetical protein
MIINKVTMAQELTKLLIRVFQLPEVIKVQIREIEIFSPDEEDKIRQSVEECYHDILSGIRFDISFYIKADENAPIYHFLEEMQKDGKAEEGHEGRHEGKQDKWDLKKVDSFWFVEIQAIAKLMRGDYLIADHLANIQINETLVAQMIERDLLYETNFHRYGYREVLDYKSDEIPGCQVEGQDKTYNMIADKLYSAAISYDRLIQRLNPEYEERRHILFEIWKQYEIELFDNKCYKLC